MCVLLNKFVFLSCLLTFVHCFDENVEIFTVASEKNDGYERFSRSAKYHGLEIQTLGLGKQWKGGDMLRTGGGYKVNLLRDAVSQYKENNNTIIIFTDSYDVVFTSPLDDIITKFKTIGSKVLFSAEKFCWPDASLKDSYPAVAGKSSRFLNSGMFMGYAPQLHNILKRPIKDTDDDQLYYTQAYLDENMRSKYEVNLDHESRIFQNLNGAKADVKLDINSDTGEGTLQNLQSFTFPNVLHGNGPSKIFLNAISNYLPGISENDLCKDCEQVEYDETKTPTISLALFVYKPTPFLEEFFDAVALINYPKDLIHFFLYNNVPYHQDVVDAFTTKYEKKYKTVKIISPANDIDEKDARTLAINQATLRESEYIFSMDAEARIDNPETLKQLISYNKPFISPIITRPNEIWSNFWGALNEAGFYARSHDYTDIISNNIRGIWNVPFVSACYLIKKTVFKQISFESEGLDPDMALCDNMRNKGVFLYGTNLDYYGHLVDSEEFDPTITKPDFYMLLSNPVDWEKRYIHPEHSLHLQKDYKRTQPCPDVYWFPIGTERFCEDLIFIMESFGRWSDGSNSDKRLEGGYEAVPTRDIHMNQVGLEPTWLRFLKLFVRPLQEAVYMGYFHDPPKSLMNFVVRYRPDEQPSLRPHHDSSTYTINIALNRAGIDYEGGGCRFLRYNCSVTDTKMGWMLMHPGRLTHFHEGLITTKGTRYIMISFVDP